MASFSSTERRRRCSGWVRTSTGSTLWLGLNIGRRLPHNLSVTPCPVLAGAGPTCKRLTGEGIETMQCPSPDACQYRNGHCKPYGRLNVVIGDEDELGSFIFRTTSFNSIRSLAARLRYFSAVSGGLLATMPLELKLRGKSTTQSYRSAIYYVDLVVQSGLTLEEAIARARELDNQRKASGFDQAALDDAARAGFGNGAFEESSEDVPAIVEEFCPDAENGNETEVSDVAITTNLKAKLDRKAAMLTGGAS
ncbi:hypothetical protein [Burkholderia gladioli]|uniref:recombination directionality factor n=1 Tax=Burkholderia gladioli TaxID=28095 RepID=UPI001FC85F14|nr:hypothetical protein [Burkholderia gladioli]